MDSWSTDDRDKLAAFLKRNPKFLQVLKGLVPKTTGKTFEEISLSANKKQGSEDVLENIEKLAVSNKTPARPPQNVDVTEGFPR
jgi:hypothetical protein